MPVFTRLREGVLVVSVDGDFAPGELQRACDRGLDNAETPVPVPVLLDLSGAAGLAMKSPEEAAAAADFFGNRRTVIAHLAVLAPTAAVYELTADGSDFATSAGSDTRAFRDRTSALEWLTGD